MKRIGVLTGGGDVPGLNPVIKSIVNRSINEGYEVVGIRNGWGGLLYMNPEDPLAVSKYTMKLDRNAVRTVDRSGGTFLHSSRTNPQRVSEKSVPEFLNKEDFPVVDGKWDFTRHVLKNLEFLKLDYLVPIGGDDTLSYAHRLHREGFHVIAVPKTMDNDVYGTDYCMGFSTSVTRAVEAIHQMRSSIGSHERIAVIELFGRNSGETSLFVAYLSGADRCLIAEVPYDPVKLAELAAKDKKDNPSNYSVITISEGAQMIGREIIETGEADPYGHRKLGGIGQVTAEFIKKHTGEDTMHQQLGYMMRSGAPDSLDLMVGANYATLAVELIKNNASNQMVALRNGIYTSIPIDTIMTGLKRVDIDEMYDVENYVPRLKTALHKPMFLY